MRPIRPAERFENGDNAGRGPFRRNANITPRRRIKFRSNGVAKTNGDAAFKSLNGAGALSLPDEETRRARRKEDDGRFFPRRGENLRRWR